MSTDPPEPSTESPPEERRRVQESPSRRTMPASGLKPAAILTVISVIVLAVSTYELVRGELGTTLAEVSSAVALVSFGFTIYGLLQMILALIESAGERRRRTREFGTERRSEERDQV